MGAVCIGGGVVAGPPVIQPPTAPANGLQGKLTARGDFLLL